MKIGHMVRIYNIEPVTSPVRRAIERRKKTPVPSQVKKDDTTAAAPMRRS